MAIKFADSLLQLLAVDAKRSSSLCSQFADEFENDLLEYEQIPKTHFDHFLTLISVKDYFQKPGIWNFVLAVHNSRDGLTDGQYKKIVAAFTNNFSDYRDGELCFAVCDFIARNFEPSKAARFLKELKQREAQKSDALQGYVDEGLYIVQQEIQRAKTRGS